MIPLKISRALRNRTRFSAHSFQDSYPISQSARISEKVYCQTILNFKKCINKFKNCNYTFSIDMFVLIRILIEFAFDWYHFCLDRIKL